MSSSAIPMKSLPMKWRNPTCPKILRKWLKFIRMRAGCTTADKKPIMLGFWFKIYNLLKMKIIHLLVVRAPPVVCPRSSFAMGKTQPKRHSVREICGLMLFLFDSASKFKQKKTQQLYCSKSANWIVYLLQICSFSSLFKYKNHNKCLRSYV